MRNAALGIKYLQQAYDIWPDTETNTSSYASLCGMLGYAYTIDGGYRDSSYLDKAVEIYLRLKETNDNVLGKIFSNRHKAVVERRIAISIEQSRPAEAKTIFTKVIKEISEIIRLQHEKNADVVDLAESYLLQAVFLKQSQSLKEAEQSFIRSLECWGKTTLHPVQLVTEQMYATLLIETGRANEAVKKLTQVWENQKKYYHSAHHLDIGKTLHFLGKAKQELGEYESALAYYKEAMSNKQSSSATQDMIQVTQKEIGNVLHCIADAYERAGRCQKALKFYHEALKNKILATLSESDQIPTKTAISRLLARCYAPNSSRFHVTASDSVAPAPNSAPAPARP